MEHNGYRVPTKVRFPSLALVVSLLSGPFWYWIQVRRGLNRDLAFWSTIAAEILAVISVCVGWGLALRRNRR